MVTRSRALACRNRWRRATGRGVLQPRNLLLLGLLVMLPPGAADVRAAESDDPFPRILTLADALAMLDDSDPSLRLNEARLARNRAAQIGLDDRNAWSSSLNLDLRGVDRIADPGHDFINDSRATLVLDKPLSRFGADEDLQRSLETGAEAISVQRDRRRAELRHQAMNAFFDVILADYAYAAQDEVMTLAFLTYDDKRELMEKFNEAPEVEVRRLEAVYLDEFAERTRLGHERRASRLRLALALNRADAYPDRMEEPDLSGYERETPDYDEVLARVLESSAEMRIARLETESARQNLAGLAGTTRPVLGARLEAAEYRQKTPLSRDQFRASLYLDIPIGGQSRQRGEIAAASALVLEKEAVEAEREHALREEVLRLVQRLAHLDAELRAAEAELLYSELDLDRVRLLYEMEVRARIGTANAVVAAAINRLAHARYRRALVWDRLDILMNNEPVQFQ